MKDLFRLFACAAIAGTLFSCQTKEEPFEPVNEDPLVPAGYVLQEFYATSEVTKTNMDENGKTVWTSNDRIRVFWSTGDTPADLFSGEDSQTGVFRAVIPDGYDVLYASYPEDINAELTLGASEIEVEIPSEKDGSFANSNIAVAKVGSGNTLNFFNAGALLCIEIPGNDIKKVVVESVDGSALAGKQVLAYSGSSWTLGSQSDEKSSISMTINGSGKKFLPILAGVTHAKGLLLKYYKDGDVLSGTYYLNKSITTQRNKVYKFGEFEPDGNYYVTADGAGKKNGLNWENAFSADKMLAMVTLTGSETAAEKAAKIAAIDGSTFYLAAGTYKWGADAEINIDEAITITVMGGYNASTGARDIANNATIFTGDDDDDNTGDHRILIIDGNMSLVFDGITFTKGATSGSGNARFGGGLWIKTGSHTFVDCTFSDNSAVYGGAIRFDSTGDLTLTRTTFSNNSTTGDAGALSFGNGKTTVTDCTFTGNSAPAGGAIDCFGSAELSILGGEFSSNAAVNNGGAIAVEAGATLRINQTGASSTSFIGNSSTKFGGALDIQTNKSAIENKIKNAIFKGNHAHDGGAVSTDGPSGKTTKVYFDYCTFGGTNSGEPNYVKTSSSVTGNSNGGAILVENDSFVNIATSSFIGNHANNNQYGGAICARGDAYVNLFSDSFAGNYAGVGGAVFTDKTDASGTNYPRIFIDECSFDANYITLNYGCAINIAKASRFIMHNSSVRGSYNSASATGEKACWIDFDGIQNCTSISNCTIIGDAASSALVWACSGSWTNYFTNNIITSTAATTDSIHSDGSTLDLSYTHYYSASSITDNGGNVSGVLSADVDGLSWDTNYWKWDGTFSGTAPAKTNKTDVTSRVNSASSDFMTWSGGDFGKDQRGVSRGTGNWWPGAYQN